MPEINLLPWRQKLQRRRKRHFLLSLGLAIGLAIMAGSDWGLFLESQHAAQDVRNRMLQVETAKLDAQLGEIKKIKQAKSKIYDRMEVIDELQNNRSKTVHLYDQLARVLVDGVSLSALSVSDNRIIMRGKAESTIQVSSFLKEIEQSYMFFAPDLIDITVDRELGDQGRQFRMTVAVDGSRKREVNQ